MRVLLWDGWGAPWYAVRRERCVMSADRAVGIVGFTVKHPFNCGYSRGVGFVVSLIRVLSG
jgi:hypothetical protein